MQLDMTIKNIKGIRDFSFSFPLDCGLYAITGENGAGKSTLISCASSVFYQMPMTEFFGRPLNASISFSLDGATREWRYDGKKWVQKSSKKKMNLNGFYEGSIIFGNRFKDTRINAIRILDDLQLKDVVPANDFVKENLGMILHNDKDYYSQLMRVKKNKIDLLGLSRITYCNVLEDGSMISQPRMSTGENLLLSILSSLDILRGKRLKSSPVNTCIVFLDEIELALHSSALRRLVLFLKEISDALQLAIFFSTHSIDLLREIKAQNIYYLSKLPNGTIMLTNPCYPAYATRNLYGDDGYGNDLVILVEDDLAKLVIERIIQIKKIARNIRFKILPTGGWTNTIALAYDVTSSKLLQSGTRLAVVLDRDIEPLVPEFISNHKQYSGIKRDFIPVSSLEKYLKNKLVDETDGELFSLLDTYLFQKRPLSEVISSYNKSRSAEDQDLDGKAFYGVVLDEVRSMRKDRDDLVTLVVQYILENEHEKVEQLTTYLNQLIN